MSKWYSRNASEARKVRKTLGARFRPEFWLKDGESAKVVFLDGEPVYLHQHEVKIRGKIKKYTCPKNGRGCPLCSIKEPRYISVYRILDTRKYKDKKGKVHTATERFYEVGSRLAPSLERMNKNGVLYKRLVEISRNGSGTETVYSAIPIGKPKFDVERSKLDVMKEYAPKSIEELRNIAEMLGMAGHEDDDRDDSNDDDDDDDEDTKKKKRKSRSYMEDIDDDDDDEDSEDEDSDDEDDDSDDDEDDEDSDEDEDEDDEEDEDEEDDDDDEEDEDERPKKSRKKLSKFGKKKSRKSR